MNFFSHSLIFAPVSNSKYDECAPVFRNWWHTNEHMLWTKMRKCGKSVETWINCWIQQNNWNCQTYKLLRRELYEVQGKGFGSWKFEIN